MRQLGLAVAFLVLVGCRNDGITIYAPPELANGSVFVDDKLVARFENVRRNYRNVGWRKLREEFSAPPRAETVAKLPAVAHGKHELRIEKAGYHPIEREFVYSGAAIQIEIGDVVKRTREGDAAIDNPHVSNHVLEHFTGATARSQDFVEAAARQFASLRATSLADEDEFTLV